MRRQLHNHRVGALVSVGVLVLLWPSAAMACAVCFGDGADSGFLRGAQWATVLMVGVTYSLFMGGVVCFLVLRRRVRRSRALETEHPGAS